MNRDQVKEFIAFDIELPVLPEVVNPKNNYGISVACTSINRFLDKVWTREDKVWFNHDGLKYQPKMTELQMENMVEYLRQLKIPIFTYNGSSFDFAVVRYVSESLKDRCIDMSLHHYDIAYHLLSMLGYMPALSSIVDIGIEKSSEGSLAPILWQQEKNQQVIDYVINDCKVLSEVVKYIMKNGFLRITSKSGNLRTIYFDEFLTVEECLALPYVDQTWMQSPLDRVDMISWSLTDNEREILKGLVSVKS